MCRWKMTGWRCAVRWDCLGRSDQFRIIHLQQKQLFHVAIFVCVTWVMVRGDGYRLSWGETADSGDFNASAIIGEPLAVEIGVRRAKKFILFCALYRSRTAVRSGLVIVVLVWAGEVDAGEAADNGDDGDVADVRDGVLERIRLAAVEVWRFDLTVAFDAERSRGRGESTVFGLADGEGTERFGVVLEFAGGFINRWEVREEEDDECALIVDVGLIERLREEGAVDICAPGAVGRGMKPKRLCIAVGGGGRFVIDIGLVRTKYSIKSSSSSAQTRKVLSSKVSSKWMVSKQRMCRLAKR